MKKILILTAILAVLLCGCTPREKKEEWQRANDKYYEPEFYSPVEEKKDPNQPVYHLDEDAEPPVYIVEQYGLKGLADADKNVIIEPRYERLYGFFGDYAVCSMTDYTAEADDFSGAPSYPDVWGVINRKGEIVVPFQMEYMEEFADGRWNFSRDGFEGVMTVDGEIIVQPKYWDVDDFRNGYAIVIREDYTHDVAKQDIAKLYYGLIDQLGNEVLPLEYDDMQWDGSVLSAVKKGEIEQYEVMGGELVKEGDVTFYMDEDAYAGFGSKVCDEPELHKYDMLHLTGLADAEGNAVTEPVFAEINQFSGGYAPAAKLDYTSNPVDASGKLEYPKFFGVIDTKGNTILDFKYNRTSLSEDGRTVYVNDSIPIATISDDGSITLLEAAEEAEKDAQNRASRTFPEMIEQDTALEENWSNHRVEHGDPKVYAFAQGELWGLADADKNTLIEARFEEIKPFRGDYAVACYTDYTAEPLNISGVDEYPMAYGVINRKGETVVEFEYSKMLETEGGFCIIEKDKKQGLMEMDGTILLEPQFDDIFTFDGYFAEVSNEDGPGADGAEKVHRHGLINDRGEILLPAEYDEIRIVSGKDGGATIVATKKGEITQYLADGHGIKKIESGSLARPQDFITKQVCDEPEIHIYEVNDLKGLIAGDGTIITEPVFSRVGEFEGGYAEAAKFDYTRDPSSFSGVLEYPQMWGVIDTEGKTVEEFTYETEIAVTGNGEIVRYSMQNQYGQLLYGYKWLGGDVFATAKYMVGGDFVDGLAVVAEFEFDPKAQDTSSGPSGYYRYGIIDTDGKAVVPLEYDEQIYVDDFSIVFKKDNTEYVFDPETREMVQNSGTVSLS